MTLKESNEALRRENKIQAELISQLKNQLGEEKEKFAQTESSAFALQTTLNAVIDNIKKFRKTGKWAGQP